MYVEIFTKRTTLSQWCIFFSLQKFIALIKQIILEQKKSSAGKLFSPPLEKKLALVGVHVHVQLSTTEHAIDFLIYSFLCRRPMVSLMSQHLFITTTLTR